MLVQIQDHEALSSLSIINLRAYLHSHGWTNEGTWGERPITIFARQHGGRTWEILVPHRDTIGGYAENMAQSVAILATVEERSQLDVFYDLVAAGADVIQVRSASRAREPSSLSLRQSADMLNDAYKMLEAGARSAENPQAIYRGRPRSYVTEYLDSVRPLPGHSRGVALTLHSPLPVDFNRQEDFGDGSDTPFSRRVTTKLALGLRHTKAAIKQAEADDTLDFKELDFKEVVEYGVSANLCDSVAKLAKKSEGITIDLKWAKVHPSNVQESYFQFSSASADILVEVAKSFRYKEPSCGEQISGQVVRLEKEPHEFDGQATIMSMWKERPIRMNVQFEQADYDVVISAFRDQMLVRLVGDVHPLSRGRYELRHPRNLSVPPGFDDRHRS